MLSFLMGKRRGRRGKMGGQPSRNDEPKRDEPNKGSKHAANQPRTSTADLSQPIKLQSDTLNVTASTENSAATSNETSEESSVKPGRELSPKGPELAKGRPLLDKELPTRIESFQGIHHETPENDRTQTLSDAVGSVSYETCSKTVLAGQTCYIAQQSDGQGTEYNTENSSAGDDCRYEHEQLKKHGISVADHDNESNESSPKTSPVSSEEKRKIGVGNTSNEVVTSTGSVRPSVTDQEREQELIISGVNSSDRGSAVNRVAASQESAKPPNAAKSLKDLEKSRKAFFMGLLEETVEEIYPEDFKISSEETKLERELHPEKSKNAFENSSDIQPTPTPTRNTEMNATTNTNHRDQPKSPISSPPDPQPDSWSEPPTLNLSKEPTGELSEKLISDGVYFAQAIETSSRPASCEFSGLPIPLDDGKYSDVLEDASVGQTNIGLNNATHERADEHENADIERVALNRLGNEVVPRDEPIFKRFDSLEPEEQAVCGGCLLGKGDEFEDDESGFFGEPVSTYESSTDDKVTDSGLGNDAEIDEILKTELDDISLDELDGISIDVVISEVKGEDVKPDEGENEEIDGNSGGNDVKIGEEREGDPAGEGVVGDRPLGKRGPPVSSPVQSAAPRDEQAVGMLTLSNLSVESFPGKLTLSSALSSSSDESIGAKVKKHVRWADTDDGRSLESYDEYSSGDDDDDEYSSGDDGGGFEGVAEATEDAAEEEEEDEDDEDASEDEESDAEENKTGTNDTFTNSEISVIVEPPQENILEDVKNEGDSSEEEESENEDEEEEGEEEINETEQKTDEETLVEKLTRLQEDLLTKAASLERAQSDLDAAVLEADKNRKKIERLQDELDSLKRRNVELQRQIDENNLTSEEKQKLELRISELERELEAVRSDRDRLENRLTILERDRNQEIQMVQQALERALEEQEAREARYQREFESERTLSSQRELQMLEDFEWKLRETEKNAKKKMESAEAEASKRIQDMEARLARAEADLERIAELKLCEIELKQLKVTSAEQRRNLRQVTRQYEDLQVNEKILQEEVNRLRAALDKEKLSITHLQALHKDELAEKERKLRVKLDVQASQITSEWEDRLRRELAKLKNELENTHREEKIVAVDMAKLLKEQEIQNLKQSWEKKSTEFKKEIAEYKRKLEEKDVAYRKEIENAQTSSDRDTLDLRRKMDKLDMEYQSRIEKMQEEHEAEMNEIRQECERKISQMEASYQLQAGTTRTTIELVKQQMTNESQARIERLQAIHRQQMEEQWEMLETTRRNEVRSLEDRHRTALEQLRKELDEIRKAVTPQSGKQSGRQKTPIPETAKQMVIDQLNQEATNPFSCGDLDGIEAVGTGSDAEKILFAKLQQMTRQANEDKLEIERLKQRLEEKECVKQQPQQQQQQQQQRQQQHPPHPTRRNRKRRN